jgi:hypothetical protein
MQLWLFPGGARLAAARFNERVETRAHCLTGKEAAPPPV